MTLTALAIERSPPFVSVFCDPYSFKVILENTLDTLDTYNNNFHGFFFDALPLYTCGDFRFGKLTGVGLDGDRASSGRASKIYKDPRSQFPLLNSQRS